MNAIDLVAQERTRHPKLGWTAEHDAEHLDGELAWYAMYYAMPEELRFMNGGIIIDPKAFCPNNFPLKRWDKDRIEQLVIAAALLVAEADRILLLASSKKR